VFVRDLSQGTTERISVASNGAQGAALADATTQAMSDDGRYVAFESLAGALRGSAENSRSHIYVHDRLTRTTHLLTGADGSSTTGSQWSSITPDGRTVVFESDATAFSAADRNNNWDVFAAASSLVTGATNVVTSAQADGRLRISGTATFAPAQLLRASDPAGDAAQVVGVTADIVGAGVSYRPAEDQLVFSAEVEDLRLVAPPAAGSGSLVPGVAANPAVLYRMMWSVGEQRYEVRVGGSETDGSGKAVLYRCDAECTAVQRIETSVGVVGDVLVFTVPTALLPGVRAQGLSGVAATTSAADQPVDAITVGAATVPGAQVWAGPGPEEDPASAVYQPLSLTGAAFAGSVPRPTADKPTLWVRTCLGSECAPQRVAPQL
jgi:hypothetical protein